MEMARDMDCVTSEVKLDKSIDFTKSLTVYSEVIREIRTPLYREHGIRILLQAALEKACCQVKDPTMQDTITNAWVTALDR